MQQTEHQIGDPTERDAWVVGIDGSETSAHALEWAARHAPGRTCRLRLATAWQEPILTPTMEGVGGGPAFGRDLLIDNAQRLADSAKAAVAAPGDITVETLVAHGGASTVLLDAAAAAALLVVGSRGRGGFRRLLLGSTSTQCATHADRPTVVVPGSATTAPTVEITVGVDGSPNSIAALGWALDFAQPGTRITALSIWDASPLTLGAEQFFFPEATDLAEQRFHHLVDTVVADHAGRVLDHSCDHAVDQADTTVTLRREFLAGLPRQVLAERSASTDLLVLGARGHGAIGAALMGSVSTNVLHTTRATTVIVPLATS